MKSPLNSYLTKILTRCQDELHIFVHFFLVKSHYFEDLAQRSELCDNKGMAKLGVKERNSFGIRAFSLIEMIIAISISTIIGIIALIALFSGRDARKIQLAISEMTSLQRQVTARIQSDIGAAARITGSSRLNGPLAGVSRFPNRPRLGNESDGVLIVKQVYSSFSHPLIRTQVTAPNVVVANFINDASSSDDESFAVMNAYLENRKVFLVSNAEKQNLLIHESHSSPGIERSITFNNTGYSGPLSTQDFSVLSHVRPVEVVLYRVSGGLLIRETFKSGYPRPNNAGVPDLVAAETEVLADHVEGIRIHYTFANKRGDGTTLAPLPSNREMSHPADFPSGSPCVATGTMVCPEWRDAVEASIEIVLNLSDRNLNEALLRNAAFFETAPAQGNSPAVVMYHLHAKAYPYEGLMLESGFDRTGIQIECAEGNLSSQCNPNCQDFFANSGVTDRYHPKWRGYALFSSTGDVTNFCKCGGCVQTGSFQADCSNFVNPSNTTALQYGPSPVQRWSPVPGANNERVNACARVFNPTIDGYWRDRHPPSWAVYSCVQGTNLLPQSYIADPSNPNVNTERGMGAIDTEVLAHFASLQVEDNTIACQWWGDCGWITDMLYVPPHPSPIYGIYRDTCKCDSHLEDASGNAAEMMWKPNWAGLCKLPYKPGAPGYPETNIADPGHPLNAYSCADGTTSPFRGTQHYDASLSSYVYHLREVTSTGTINHPQGLTESMATICECLRLYGEEGRMAWPGMPDTNNRREPPPRGVDPGDAYGPFILGHPYELPTFGSLWDLRQPLPASSTNTIEAEIINHKSRASTNSEFFDLKWDSRRHNSVGTWGSIASLVIPSVKYVKPSDPTTVRELTNQSCLDAYRQWIGPGGYSQAECTRPHQVGVDMPAAVRSGWEAYSGYCRDTCNGWAWGAALSRYLDIETERDQMRRIVTNTIEGQNLPLGCGGQASSGTTYPVR